ncbi:hypothetical protein [Formosa haliotis]|uniref:hypothetical protein n=1 Tax=Formosa haliotis TaxID=1555194 RepID=UPI000826CA24|nr:hypothetical protein [Formosa haliotis]
MNSKLTFIFLILVQIGYSQQYDSVIIEEDSIDLNNKIYKPGSVFVYDYEIIIKDKKYKLKKNRSRHNQEKKKREVDFELVQTKSDSIGTDKIHLLVKPVEDTNRTNENQTQISYLEEPMYASLSSTGAVENSNNVWIHPIREGFFNSLETAPFPFIKSPLEIGTEWTDQMLIGEGWGNEMWGKWEGELLLTYNYKITDKKTVNTEIGNINCYIIESTAKSNIGITKLTSYFSEKYGFVRLEYELLNELKVNMWLIDYKTDKVFNDTRTFFKTKEYIKQ